MQQVVVFGVLFFLNFVVLSWLLEFVLTFLIRVPFRILWSLLRLLGVKRFEKPRLKVDFEDGGLLSGLDFFHLTERQAADHWRNIAGLDIAFFLALAQTMALSRYL